MLPDYAQLLIGLVGGAVLTFIIIFGATYHSRLIAHAERAGLIDEVKKHKELCDSTLALLNATRRMLILADREVLILQNEIKRITAA